MTAFKKDYLATSAAEFAFDLADNRAFVEWLIETKQFDGRMLDAPDKLPGPDASVIDWERAAREAEVRLEHTERLYKKLIWFLCSYGTASSWFSEHESAERLIGLYGAFVTSKQKPAPA